MTSRRALRLAGAALVTLCTGGSAAAGGAAAAPPDTSTAVETALLRSTAWVAPVQVLVAAAPAASTTVTALPQVPVTLSQSGIPGRALAAYRAAAERVAASPSPCRVRWPLLAAIGFVESGHGSVHGGALDAEGRVSPPILGPRLDGSGAFALIRDTDGGRLDGDAALDRAVGPMQFIPSTWARHGADGDGNGSADPHDLDDAALSAAGYLCRTSRNLDRPADVIRAVFSYNHSYDYVRVVLTAAARYAGESPGRWGVGLLPAPTPAQAQASPLASAVPLPVDAAPGEAVPEPAPTPEAPAAAPSPEPPGQQEPVPQEEPTAEGQPSPESEQTPQQEAPQDEQTSEPEPSPEGEPGATPAAAG